MKKSTRASNSVEQERDYYEGERLARLLKSIHGGIESARLVDNNSLPEKFWFKQQFAVGVNEVTRNLERMLPSEDQKPAGFRKPPAVRLQAVLIAHDSNPKWLTKHLPVLASTRKVPVIFVRDKKGGSLCLGELVRLKTAIAVGVKDRGSSVNRIVKEILEEGNETRQPEIS